MLKDVEIREMSSEIDDMLALLKVKYSMSVLSLSAIVNARLMLANKESGSQQQYFELLQSIVGAPPQSNFTNFSRH